MNLRSSVKTLAVIASAFAFAASAAAADGKIDILWYGQAAFKLTSPGGKIIVIDPFITKNPKTPESLKDLAKIGGVDAILITHGHGDHVGDSVELAKLTGAKVVGPVGLIRTMTALGVLPADQTIGLNKGGTVTPAGEAIKISMVAAEHSSEFTWKNPDTGKTEHHVGGEPIGYVIEFENGFRAYHAGDTAALPSMALIQEFYAPDLLMLPIGGHFTMGPAEAAYATKIYFKAKYALPMHYGTFPPLKGTPAEYKAALGDAKIKVLDINPGDQVSLPE